MAIIPNHHTAPQKRDTFLRLSLPLLLGAILILLIAFGMITWQNVRQQTQAEVDLLIGKGTALIRSFEAGARFGVRGRVWSNRWLQILLEETAQQPDIHYILLVDADGQILAHTDLDRIGTRHTPPEDFATAAQTHRIAFRFITTPDNQSVFEVFRRFSPERSGGPPGALSPSGPRPGMGMMTMRTDAGIPPSAAIFIGFDGERLQEMQRTRLLHAIITGTILFLAGSAGMIILFLFQHYRTTRASLDRIQAFSDHLVDNLPIGLLTIDHEHRLSSLNRTAASLLDLKASTDLGKPSVDVLPPELATLIPLPDNLTFFEYEIRCWKGGEGDPISLEVGLSRLENTGTTDSGFMLLLKDVSEIHRLKKEVARSQHLAALGRMAAGVAHEIRNPLSSIKGFATYFRERYQAVPKDLKIADIMIAETERLNRSVGQLLELAKPVRLQRRRTDTSALINDAIRLSEPQATAKKITIHATVADDVQECVVDRDRLLQVLLNLNLNAIEAMPAGGRLSIHCDRTPDNGYIRLSVTDNGPGIPADHLSRIFDPYFTTRPAGSGLGLAIVHNIVEAHQGKIDVESREDEGSRFTITLPRLEETDENNKTGEPAGG
jgi:two-component system, NtrC family, sensor histidine kinase HydH